MKKEALYADVIIYVLLIFGALIALLPMIHVLAKSFSSEVAILGGQVNLLPVGFNLEAYKVVMKNSDMIGSLFFTIYLTLLGTTINVMITALGAYPLAQKDLPGRKIIWFMILGTMFFSGGLIPTFLVVRSLGLLDTIWALILPGTVATFNLILMKTFFQGLPTSLLESARMDGAPEILILFRIVLPLSTPVIATLTLFYGIGHWNQYFAALIFITDSDKFPIQLMLQRMMGIGMDSTFNNPDGALPIEAMKSAVVYFAILPVLFVFPLLQKHFTKGALLGSIKE